MIDKGNLLWKVTLNTIITTINLTHIMEKVSVYYISFVHNKHALFKLVYLSFHVYI